MTMRQESSHGLSPLADTIHRFGLTSLLPVLRSCEELAGADAPLDIAVIGQFKCGKSSLLNAVLGADIFPVGVLPATALVTRALAGPTVSVRVRHLDGTVEPIGLERIGEFVTEAGNPENSRQAAVVDVQTPALRDWPGIRLVDTPGLGSVFTHNTRATHDWLPNMAVALIAVSAERPFSDEDRKLLDDARSLARRVAVVLTKVDLLSAAEQEEVLSFLERKLREACPEFVTVLPFSTRVDTDRWLLGLRSDVILPVVHDVVGERRKALAHKRTHLTRACRGYLEVGLHAAERANVDRERLRAAVLDESVNAAVIRDELRLAEQRVCGGARPAFDTAFLAQQTALARRLTDALAAELQTWRGNLAQQTGRFEAWLAERLETELTPLSRDVASLATDLVAQAEGRLRRMIEAFRDRLGRNIREATGVTVSPATWEVKPPQLAVIPVRVGRTFMTNWELIWWLLPMRLVGGLFRQHVRGLVPWEVEKNLARLSGDWAGAVGTATAELRTQAMAWVQTELATLDRLLGQRPA
jgi:GTP-binding protein EngB required for normal cell division